MSNPSPAEQAGGEVAADEPLTTKEGWRRFVDRQPITPDLHNPATVELLTPADRDAYEQERRDYHADLPRANTPTIQKVISTARLLAQLNRNRLPHRRPHPDRARARRRTAQSEPGHPRRR